MTKSEELKKLIEEKVYVQNKDEQIDAKEDPDVWLFDFRRIIMNGKSSDLIAEIFFEKFKDQYPFQLCTLEVAGVPLLTSLINKFYQNGYKDINGFFLRKSRKKSGLLRMIEGEILETKKIVLIDDIMNSGSSFWRQVVTLEELGYKVDSVWSILRFRDKDYYKRFHNRGIKIESLYELDDLTDVLGPRVKNLLIDSGAQIKMPFKINWVFKSKKPSLNWVVPKSQPVIDREKIYFGSDNETFWALNQKDGSVAWKHTTGSHTKKKSIFSNPALHKDTVIFGAYDGNVYSLNKNSGEPKWIYMDADWVGSSPAISKNLNMVYIGLEYGLIRKRGGIVALNADTGEQIWIDRTHKGMTHCSPKYLEEHEEVVIGSNDGVVRLYNARNGEIKWTFTTFGGAHESNVEITGFGEGDIKESFAYNAKHDCIAFGSIDSFLYILDRNTGNLMKHHKCKFGIIGTPFIHKNKVYFTSLDKHIRCLDLDSMEIVFEENVDSTRLFSNPIVINERLYIGTNGARLYELDLLTGKPKAYFQALERITNNLVYNKETNTYFLPTFANEIISLERREDSVDESDKVEG